MQLVGGPLDGKEIDDPQGARIAFPFVRENERSDDQVLGQWVYGRDGHFIEEKIDTTTMNADALRRHIEWLWRDVDRSSSGE